MKKFILFVMIAFVPFVVFAQSNENATSGVERYAIFVGSNNGSKDQQRLLYAGTDAIAFKKTMSEIGGIPQTNGILLLDPSKSDLDEAMQVVSSMISANKHNSKRSEFLFYYSGHSDESALLLGKSTYGYSELKAAISSVPSDVHVVILDSCYSGNFIRTKGGQKQKPFLVDDSTVVKGHAYLSSSSSQEFSQESDEIGSSFFTNAMLTGLRGAADSSGDKKVTLNELYSYAFSETLSKTENSTVGPQHPNYNITLVGSGDLILSDISNSDSIVMLTPDLKGRLILRDKNGKLISEVNKLNDNPLYLALEKGEYNATLIGRGATLQGSFQLNSGKIYELSPNSLMPVAAAFHRVRGEKLSERDSGENKSDEDSNDIVGFHFDLSENEVYVPVEFSLVDNELSKQFNKKVLTSFSLGLLRSKVYKVNGAMVAFGINEAEYLRGLQFSYFINRAEYVEGVQYTSIFNQTGHLKGMQASGIFNVAKDVLGFQAAGIFSTAHNVEGMQASGIFNVSHDFLGMQAAGIYNVAKKTKGFQAAGIVNKADDFEGFQLAGIANHADAFKGCQIAGIVNIAHDCTEGGVQIGVINIAGDFNGIQLGLLNISKNGVLEFGTSYTSNDNLRFIVNSGVKQLYTVFGCSVARENAFDVWIDDKKDSIFIGGLGSRLTVNKFNFDVEWLANFVTFKKDEATIEKEKAEAKAKGDDEDDVFEYETHFFPSIRFSIGFTPIKHLQFFGGASFAVEYEKNAEAFEHIENKIKIDASDLKLYPEFDFGVRYSFN